MLEVNMTVCGCRCDPQTCGAWQWYACP